MMNLRRYLLCDFADMRFQHLLESKVHKEQRMAKMLFLPQRTRRGEVFFGSASPIINLLLNVYCHLQP
jgi:hypothetical protein